MMPGNSLVGVKENQVIVRKAWLLRETLIFYHGEYGVFSGKPGFLNKTIFEKTTSFAG